MSTPTRNLQDALSYYVTLKDDYVYYKVEGAKSFLLVDEQVFLQSNYRDSLSAAFAGGPATAMGSNKQVDDSVTSVAITLTDNKNIIEESDQFTHTAPRPEQFKRTVLVFFDSADNDSGNVIAYFDFAKVDQFGPNFPKRY